MSTNSKKVGVFALTALVISSSIGSGIFAIPTDMAAATAPGGALLGWLIAGMGVLTLCLSIVNIGQKKPELAGIVSYAEEGFGPFNGFISGWGYWLSAWLGTVSVVIMMMKTLSRLFPIFGNGDNFLSIAVGSALLWFLCYLVNRGVESAIVLNTIIAVCKIVPLALCIILAFLFFDMDTFMTNFWGTQSGQFELSSVAKQVQNSMMTIMWVFVGIEGAAMMSDRAKSQSVVGKSTVLGLISLAIIYVSASILPYGILTQEQIANLPSPALGYVFTQDVGSWFPIFVNIALVISLFGSWLSWMMLPVETTAIMAQRHLLSPKFAELNDKDVPTFSLVFMTALIQVFMLTLLVTDQAYQFAYTLCTASMFISWLYVVLYQVKLAYQTKEMGQLWIGLAGSAFFIWVIWVSGFDYVLLCLIAYLAGIAFYYQARKQAGFKTVFSQKEWLLVAVLVLGAIWALARLFGGQITI
ncbi:arginine-ornithine antiporter [Streptococcus cuniculipharyngis]|uniref:Arginine-ornithine antiporter n=1 Tax=Streptococcus cuniculipharyngis TaxID=1562651 RepID=A0A5C5SBD5_9STRE|nr:arginine-ornithine antiporter [Streptococcus cuniculipharyngis]TWS98076.1 arginine-ornithine antiporter [Streptococcus cuniculipharyngis]